MTKQFIHLLGYAAAVGGVNLECGEGPLVLRQSHALQQLIGQLAGAGISLQWGEVITPWSFSAETRAAEVERLCLRLAAATADLTRHKAFFIVTGGDHTAAIGTWSGVRAALPGPLGLIWVDAHMDSHTPATSVTGRLHGMPLAALLGYGDVRFTQLLTPVAKIDPRHLCLIGVRSYEAGEAKLLKELGVRIFFMEEVKQRGLSVVFQEAVERVTQGTVGYGLSLDIDSLDPQEAPGVDVPEPDGLQLRDLCAALQQVAGDARLQGVEMVEFDPQRDIQQRTERAIVELIQVIGLNHAKR